MVTQPGPVVYQRRYGSGDHYLILSIIMSFVCFFFGTWWALVCTIPAIFMAINVSHYTSVTSMSDKCIILQAQEAERRGDTVTMERNRRSALRLNIGAIIVGVVSWILLIVIIVIRAAIVSAYAASNN